MRIRRRGRRRDAPAAPRAEAAPRARAHDHPLRDDRAPADPRRRRHGSGGHPGRPRRAVRPVARPRRAAGGAGDGSPQARRPSLQRRLAQAVGRGAVRRNGSGGRQEGQDGRLFDRQRHSGAAGRAGPRHRPEGAGLAPARQAEEHLYRQPPAADRPEDGPGAYVVRARHHQYRAAVLDRSRTSRTSRSAPRKAARSAGPSSPSRATSCCRSTIRRSSFGWSPRWPGSRR